MHGGIDEGRQRRHHQIGKESLKVRDHIYSWKAAWVYAHHGDFFELKMFLALRFSYLLGAWIDYLDITPAPFGEHIYEPFCLCIKSAWLICFSSSSSWKRLLALIQQWEVSWDDTLDPAVSYKIGQVVDAKVIHLDYNNSRIFLSLKDVKFHPSISETAHYALDSFPHVLLLSR
uniref:S1 motif domain-containing protein n=1 Tax=Zea mays TaxID=4577 RepID=A0A804LF91_MAIZE